MEKAKLTKAQAKALEAALDFCGRKSLVVINHQTAVWSGHRKPLMELSTETLLEVLFEGYEVEPTPEEQIKELFEALVSSVEFQAGARSGIIDTLNYLDLKIVGVNC